MKLIYNLLVFGVCKTKITTVVWNLALKYVWLVSISTLEKNKRPLKHIDVTHLKFQLEQESLAMQIICLWRMELRSVISKADLSKELQWQMKGLVLDILLIYSEQLRYINNQEKNLQQKHDGRTFCSHSCDLSLNPEFFCW